MNLFLLNLFAALIWASLWQDLSGAVLLAGFAIGFGCLWLVADRRAAYFRCVIQSAILLAYFIKELILSSIRVAHSAIRPRMGLRPAIVQMPLDAKTDLEIFLVANLITLTPGTLILDVAPDRSYLTVHSIYAEDTEALVAELKSGMEHRVLKVFRP